MAIDSHSPRRFPDQAISAVVPCFNEVECIGEAFERISGSLTSFREYEILFIDDGSSDGTLTEIKALAARDDRVRYLSFSRNFGLEAAFSAGFRYASFPWLAQFDADLQSPPEEVGILFEKALEGYDAVFSERIDRQDPFHRRIGSTLQHVIAGRLLGIQLPRRGSIFRVLRTSVARKVVELDLGMPYFLATLPLVGARYTSVSTSHRARYAGESKWRLRRLLGHTMELYIGFSTRPLAAAVGVSLATVTAMLLLAVLGIVDGSRGLAILGLIGNLALVGAIASLAPYLLRVIRGQSRSMRLYQIREANVEIHPHDYLYQYEPPADRDLLATDGRRAFDSGSGASIGQMVP